MCSRVKMKGEMFAKIKTFGFLLKDLRLLFRYDWNDDFQKYFIQFELLLFISLSLSLYLSFSFSFKCIKGKAGIQRDSFETLSS